MKNKSPQHCFIYWFLVIALTACNGQVAVVSTSTLPPNPTDTSTPPPTFTPAITPTPPSTETPVSRSAALIGTIYLSGTMANPFISSVELRQKDSFNLIGKSDTDSNGSYKIESIDPGIYELWILITTKIAMVSGCSDIAPPDNNWKIGINFGGDKALTMGDAYLSNGLLLAQNLPTSDLKAEAFFAVLDSFNIEPGNENKMDVTLLCK